MLFPAGQAQPELGKYGSVWVKLLQSARWIPQTKFISSRMINDPVSLVTAVRTQGALEEEYLQTNH